LANAAHLKHIPRGLVGYEAIGRQLSQLNERGNILVATVQQSELIFRYRCHSSRVQRSFIRADRSLAIRQPDYTDLKPTLVARNYDDVLSIVRRGRVRYIVTNRFGDTAPNEMNFLHSVVKSRPDAFALIAEFPLEVHYSISHTRGQVFVWRFTGGLADGPSEIPVVVPTAGLTIQPET
jgi:hypothetical protein